MVQEEEASEAGGGEEEASKMGARMLCSELLSPRCIHTWVE